MGKKPLRTALGPGGAMIFFSRLVALCALCVAPSLSSAADLRGRDGQSIDMNTTPAQQLPVLFVHGHDFGVNPGAGLPFQENWLGEPAGTQPDGLTSVQLTLDRNSELGIEPYYIYFADQDRAITEDAREIESAVDAIVLRHNEGYNTDNPQEPPPVQVVIIAYSKGTISTRQYLKSLTVSTTYPDGITLPTTQLRPNYRPVSEFIAISPPNHGIASLGVEAPPLIPPVPLSLRQLNNGRKGQGNCGQSFNDPRADHFIEILNGEANQQDFTVESSGSFPSEAPGSRESGTSPRLGTLYVTLYATGNADAVGGEGPSTACEGRVVAKNLSPHAINIPVPDIQGIGPLTVHANTVHTPEVICKALYAAVHHRSPLGQTCVQDGDIPIIPLNRTVAILALDFSGSMRMPACPGCAASRFDVLRESVELFAGLWSMMGRVNDRLGVTYFQTSVERMQLPNTSPPPDPLPPLARWQDVVGDVNGRTPANRTAMGGALQVSIDALLNLNLDGVARRHVILFTDGMQNVNPMVVSTSPNPPPYQYVIADETGRPSSGVTPHDLRLDSSSEITVDTIGVGAGETFLAQLDGIARATGGKFFATINPQQDLRSFFVEELVDTLRGFSPQLIAYRRGTVANAGTTESFTVNGTARKVLLKLSWPRGQTLKVRAFKDGVDVTGRALVAVGGFYNILAFDPPAGAGGLAGQWQLRIDGQPGTRYEAAAIVDETELRYQARFGSRSDRVGTALELALQVRADQRPIDGRITVTAVAERPRVAIGNVLATMKPLAVGRPGYEPGMSLAERQLAAIFSDEAAWKAIQPATEDIRVEGDGKGAFRAVLPKISVPGLYRMTLRISGEDSKLGRFERTETVSTVVRFGDTDLKKSALTFQARPGNVVRLTLKPGDGHGNLLGPGLAKAIALQMPAGRVARPRDLGDGRYRFTLSLPRRGEPTLTLAVADQPLFKGTLKDLQAAAQP